MCVNFVEKISTSEPIGNVICWSIRIYEITHVNNVAKVTHERIVCTHICSSIRGNVHTHAVSVRKNSVYRKMHRRMNERIPEKNRTNVSIRRAIRHSHVTKVLWDINGCMHRFDRFHVKCVRRNSQQNIICSVTCQYTLAKNRTVVNCAAIDSPSLDHLDCTKSMYMEWMPNPGQFRSSLNNSRNLDC